MIKFSKFCAKVSDKKKFLGLNQWASDSLPLSIGNVPQQYIGGNQISGESLLYRL
jgi:hypothetical protein